MSKEILEALDKEIIRLMTELGTLDPKSKEYDDVAGVLEGLHKLRDRELAAGNSERELELKERTLMIRSTRRTNWPSIRKIGISDTCLMVSGSCCRPSSMLYG